MLNGLTHLRERRTGILLLSINEIWLPQNQAGQCTVHVVLTISFLNNNWHYLSTQMSSSYPTISPCRLIARYGSHLHRTSHNCINLTMRQCPKTKITLFSYEICLKVKYCQHRCLWMKIVMLENKCKCTNRLWVFIFHMNWQLLDYFEISEK